MKPSLTTGNLIQQHKQLRFHIFHYQKSLLGLFFYIPRSFTPTSKRSSIQVISSVTLPSSLGLPSFLPSPEFSCKIYFISHSQSDRSQGCFFFHASTVQLLALLPLFWVSCYLQICFCNISSFLLVIFFVQNVGVLTVAYFLIISES